MFQHIHTKVLGVLVHFTTKCLQSYVYNMILSKIEWFVNLRLVLTKMNKMYICILYCIYSK